MNGIVFSILLFYITTLWSSWDIRKCEFSQIAIIFFFVKVPLCWFSCIDDLFSLFPFFSCLAALLLLFSDLFTFFDQFRIFLKSSWGKVRIDFCWFHLTIIFPIWNYLQVLIYPKHVFVLICFNWFINIFQGFHAIDCSFIHGFRQTCDSI